jgi:acyl-CoA reductase-like NAD-dependent aldehyde dehydrogenase
VICEEGIHDAFVEKYVKAAKKLKIGYGNNEGITMGPCVSEGQRKTVLDYVEVGKKDGAELVLGGKALTKSDHADGWFMEPTIFTGVKPNMRIAQEEIFGPVVSVLKAKNFDDALKISNGIDYGLSSAIFTKNVDQAFRAFRDIEAGITYVNAATIGAEAHMPFGGLKATGNGHREGGWEVYEFYSETKSCYVDYSGKLQRAQIDE